MVAAALDGSEAAREGAVAHDGGEVAAAARGDEAVGAARGAGGEGA